VPEVKVRDPLILQALEPVIHTLEALGIPYQIVGSVASSAYGIARSTLDVDITVDMDESQVNPLVESLRHVCYIDEDRVRDAATRRTSFNAIHLESMIKVDVFVLKPTAYDRAAFARRRMEDLGESGAPRLLYLASPEDVILQKLIWYHQGGRVSERQWNDILGVLKVQHSCLDMDYMNNWSEVLGLTDLLLQALRDAGIG
jgi:hypothetical protein